MLASMLMESAFGVPNVSNELLARYTHEDGATLIAMETATDLHEIFMEGFYEMEELEFTQCRAAMEGASEDVMEGIGQKLGNKARGAVTKIKEKLKSLWEKIKSFFHNVKRYFASIFMNASDFAKKYQKELKALKLKGFEVNVFDYTPNALSDVISKIYGIASKTSDMVSDIGDVGIKSEDGASMSATHNIDDVKELAKGKRTILDMVGVGSRDEFADGCYSTFRGGKGAKSKDDRNSVTITNLTPYVDELIKSKGYLSDVDKMQRDMDKSFKTILDWYKKQETAMTDVNASKAAKITRDVYNGFSQFQSMANTALSAYKTGVKEMMAAYKGICIKALGPGRVEKDDKKK